MALVQSDWGLGRKQAPVSREGGGVVVEKFTYTVTSDLAIGDKIELGILPAYHHNVDATLIIDGMGASVTANVGIMSGSVGSPDAARTVGNEMFAAADVASDSVVRMSKAEGFTLAPANDHRSIGIEIAGAGVTASDQEITLVLQYVQ